MKDDLCGKIDLNLLTVFDAIMAESSLTKAGERLGMTQSAVSHALGRLREVFQDRLFIRTGRGVRPTPRALELSTEISQTLDRLRAILRNQPAEFDEGSPERTFIIDIPAGIDAVLVPELAKHTRAVKKVGFQISGNRAGSIMRELRYGDSWLALDYEPTTTAHYRSEKLLEDPFVVISRKNHPALRRGLSIELFQSVEHIALTWSRDFGTTPFAQRLAQTGIRRNVKFAVPSAATLPAVVANEDLVGVVSMKMARAFSNCHAIDIHALPDNLPPMPVYMVWHESFDRDEGHKWLRDTMKKVCAAL